MSQPQTPGALTCVGIFDHCGIQKRHNVLLFPYQATKIYVFAKFVNIKNTQNVDKEADPKQCLHSKLLRTDCSDCAFSRLPPE